MRAEPGRLLAHGREADVYECGRDRVLRRYRHREALDSETIAMRHARAHGFPAPEVLDVDGTDIVMERVEGHTMLADLRFRPWRVNRHADLLADLHQRLHAIPAPPGLTARFGSRGDAFLHFDLHPENVMLGRSGPVVIDWPNARRGEAAADAAYTWVILATSEIPGNVIVGSLAGVLRNTFVRRFLSRFSGDDLLSLLPAACEHRLRDRNVTAPERASIRALLERGSAAPPPRVS